MKCPQCSVNHSYKSGMNCRCGYQFVLDPKRDGYTDGKLLAVVRKASAADTQYFTFPQLATAAVGLRKSLFPMMCWGLLLLIIAGALFFYAPNLFPIAGFLCFGGIVLLVSGIKGHGSLDVKQLRKAVEKYEAGKRPLTYLLRDDRPLAVPPVDWPEDDLYDYGVEGILVVERPILADLFVMNGQHAAHRILVVSECGYPEYIVPHVNRILDEQPSVPVFALHDASPSGATMVSRLKNSSVLNLFDHQITDLGMHSADLKRMPKLRQFESNGEVAIDHLAWGRLSSGLGVAMVGGMTLVDVIGQDPETSSMMSFG